MTDSTTKKPAELESLRADIDRSDEAIVGALRTRLGAVRRIAEVKRLQGLPVYDAVREASLLYKLRSMAGSDVEGVALPVYRTMMAAARRFEAQSQEAGEAVSGTVTLRLRSPADFTAVTEIFAVHDYVPESLSWVNPVIVLSATKPLPASMVRDLREHGIRTRTRRKLNEGSSEIIDALRQGHVSYVINTIDINQHNTRLDGYEIRRTAVENNVTVFTALETVKVLLDVLEEITLRVSTIDSK